MSTSIEPDSDTNTRRARAVVRAWQVGVSAAVAALLLCIGASLTGTGDNVVVAARASAHPTTDGRFEPVWESAARVTIPLRGGTSGVPWLELRALYDKRRIFFLLQWPDGEESIERSPWEFDGTGWTRIPPEVLYEDKVAFYWPITRSPSFEARGCTAACHYGGGESGAYRKKGGRVSLLSTGAHRTELAGELMDEWHWKAARTNPLGQLDDGYVNADRPTEQHTKGGRCADEPAETGGGYKDNMTAEGDGPAYDFPPGHAGQRLLLLETEAAPVTSAGRYQHGDRVPGLVLAPLSGKRGEVEARGAWQQGQWTLEIARDLSTGDANDVDFSDPGRMYPFAVAVFNNRQFEHSYNLGVYWLRIE